MASMKNCIRPYKELEAYIHVHDRGNEIELTVQTTIVKFETGRGLSVTPSSAARPWPNVVLISLNGQVLGDIIQSM